MVDKLPFFREMVVKMDEGSDRFAVWLALYFLPTKDVRVVSTHYRPNEPLSFERISRQRPLFIQNYGCEGVGHDETMTVPDVGCLLLAPPSLTFMTSYPFNRSFLFVDFEGLGPRESQGRWNSRREVTFELTADLRRTWVYQDTYVNFRLSPRVSPAAPRQRLVLSWGADQHAELSLSTREWISLPVGPADWSGDKVRKLPITVVFPDGAEPHWVEGPDGRYTEERPIAVVFEDLSITVTPVGRAVRRTAAAVR